MLFDTSNSVNQQLDIKFANNIQVFIKREDLLHPNISGNKFRLVTIVVFFQGFLHIRFVGTHAEYDKIKDIKNI